MNKYKVIPYIDPDDNKKAYIIVSNDKYEFTYSANGREFTIYYHYEQAEDHCNHLNGDGKVWGIVSMSDWEIFKKLIKGEI